MKTLLALPDDTVHLTVARGGDMRRERMTRERSKMRAGL
jgi:hypothetical protein